MGEGGCRKSLGERILCAHQRGFTDEEVKGLSSLLPRSLSRLPRRLVLIAVVQYCKFPPSARGPHERHGGWGEGAGVVRWRGGVKVLTGFKERLHSVFGAQTENGEKPSATICFKLRQMVRLRRRSCNRSGRKRSKSRAEPLATARRQKKEQEDKRRRRVAPTKKT